VNRSELVMILFLVAVLLGLAGYFGWRQLLALRGIASPDALGYDDRRFVRAQAYRRLFCSLLMVVFAGLLIGWLFLEPGYSALHEEVRARLANDPTAVATEEQRDTLRTFTSYWIGALLVLLVLIAVAAVDFWSTTRYGLHQHRQLKADHRAFIEDQVARRRRERNGQH
jgi:MFS family permease